MQNNRITWNLLIVLKYIELFKAVCNRAKQINNYNFILNFESKAAWTIVKSELGCKKIENFNFPDLIIDEKPLKISNEIAEFF